MTHDLFCPQYAGGSGDCCCHLIDAVREDERQLQFEATSDDWTSGYWYGLKTAAHRVECMPGLLARRAEIIAEIRGEV